VAGPEKADNL